MALTNDRSNIFPGVKVSHRGKTITDTGSSKQYISFLTTTCQTWLSQLRTARTNASPKNKVEYKKAI